MIVLVDIGNSAVKWAASHDLDKINEFNVAEYKNSDFIDVLHSSWHTLIKPEYLIVSSVAGNDIAEKLTHWSLQHWQINPEFVKVENDLFGIHIAYEDITQFGVDRWLALIAAWKKYNNTLCVVDCGTAITIDGLSSKGQHMGGFIIPGIQLMRESLCNNTQAITEVSKIAGNPEFATNTREGIASGTTFAVVSLVERVIHGMKSEINNDITCVITGRGAQLLTQSFTINIEHDPHLVLQGLAFLAKEKI